MIRKWKFVISLLAINFFPTISFAQQILIDRGVHAGDLWCFPLVKDTLTYRYLPSQARLALTDQGYPQFSLLRYVINEPDKTTSGTTITDAAGGALLHFLVLYETPSEAVTRAQSILRKRLKEDDIKLTGPVIFENSRYALRSSILTSSKKTTESKILATGQAPVLEGNRIALSFHMEPQNSTLLLESFKMATPDISLVFDMSFTGLTEAYDAELLIDWSEVRKSKSYKAGGSVYFVGAQVELMFDDLFRNHAIQLKTSGSDESMENLLNTVYSKLLELMFRPVEPERVPKSDQGDLLEALTTFLSRDDGPASSSKTTGFGLNVGYQLKEIKSEGKSVLNFNSRASIQRHHYITFNIGNLYSQYGQNEKFFRAAPLDDPDYKKRTIYVSVDGTLANEFRSLVNSVTVQMRKRHEKGAETFGEVSILRQTWSDSTGILRMSYPSIKDSNRVEWLNYEYRTHWIFQGGGDYKTNWTQESAPMINLYTPYERRSVQLIGDESILISNNVRSVVVQLSYPFFNRQHKPQIVMRPGNQFEEKQFNITLPINHYRYDYTITWYLKNGQRLTSTNTDSSGLIFIDELPDS